MKDTVKFIKAAEGKWASLACSPQPDLKAVIADDFQGTSPSGRRYGKDEAITTDTKSLSRDCQLGEVKVRFFGDSIAIAYGLPTLRSSARARGVVQLLRAGLGNHLFTFRPAPTASSF